MNNENNSQTENNNYVSNIRDLLKFIISTIINILIMAFLVTFSVKNNLSIKNLSKKRYKKLILKPSNKLRSLDDNDFFNKIERHIIFGDNHNDNNIEDDMKKYINLILQSFGFDPFQEKFSGKTYVMSKDYDYLEKQKQLFLSRLVKNIYSGKWEFFPYIPVYKGNSTIKNISKIDQFYYLNSSKKKFKIGSQLNGSVNFNFKKAVEMNTKQEALALTMQNFEGNFIDNWIQHISYIKMSDLNKIIDEKNELFIVKGEFSTSMIKGKLFTNNKKNRNYKQMQCSTLGEIYFHLEKVSYQKTLNNRVIELKNISTINPNNFTMILSSTCGFRIKIKAEIFDSEKEYYDIKNKVNYFSIFCLISSILYLIGASCLNYSLKRNEYAISCICLETYCQNIAWHSYCTITNINLGLIYYDYFGNFLIIAVFPVINLIAFDLRFLYSYWRIKKRVVNDRKFIILRLKFFIIFYGLLIISFFSISSFFINKVYITLLAFAIWTPQIIHNIVYNNKYIYPTFFILATTIDRVIYPFYFRGFNNNFLQIKSDIVLIIFLFIYIIVTVIIIYLQTFLGARFMLPERFQKKNLEFYKTKEELLFERPDCIKEECVICISPLIDKDKIINNINKNILQNNITNSIEEEENTCNNKIDIKNDNTSRSFNRGTDLINNEINKININNNTNNKKNLKNKLHLPKNKKEILSINVKSKRKHRLNNSITHRKKKFLLVKSIIRFMKIIKIIFFVSMFKFYKLKSNFGSKKYMVIACGHMFHSECVEKWFDRKKECPNCRASMEEFL